MTANETTLNQKWHDVEVSNKNKEQAQLLTWYIHIQTGLKHSGICPTLCLTMDSGINDWLVWLPDKFSFDKMSQNITQSHFNERYTCIPKFSTLIY